MDIEREETRTLPGRPIAALQTSSDAISHAGHAGQAGQGHASDKLEAGISDPPGAGIEDPTLRHAPHSPPPQHSTNQPRARACSTTRTRNAQTRRPAGQWPTSLTRHHQYSRKWDGKKHCERSRDDVPESVPFLSAQGLQMPARLLRR